jgi:hypothetical protein
VDKAEMRAVLEEHLAAYRSRSYSELASFVQVKRVDALEIRGKSGADYQIEVQFFWDGCPEGDIRVMGSIDEIPHRPLLGFLPIYVSAVTDAFIMNPQGAFVGE